MTQTGTPIITKTPTGDDYKDKGLIERIDIVLARISKPPWLYLALTGFYAITLLLGYLIIMWLSSFG